MEVELARTPTGLSAAEVAERRAQGRHNEQPDRTSRSYASIVRGNVLTRFNAIISVLAAVVLAVGSPIDALFALVMVFNTVIGIVQEVRAKRTLDRLQVLITPEVTVVRDGAEQQVTPAELVLDDLIRLVPGDQVPVDGTLVGDGTLEADESALTGEAEPVLKRTGDPVLSGSAVLAGSALVLATRVGRDAWIHQLVAQAKEFVLTNSELRAGVDRLLRLVGWILGPLALLLLWSQLRGNATVTDGLIAAVAGVVGLVPQGLVLLVSLAMAVAIIRLAGQRVVVQELYAVEGLARVDVLCVDKTGTLTTGRFEVEGLECLDGDPGALRAGLSALVAAEVSPTASTRVLAEALPGPPAWVPAAQVAFSSARKWSGTTFAGHGTWVLGAPDVLLDAALESGAPGAGDPYRCRVAELSAQARRVLLVGHCDQSLGDEPELPAGLRPRGLVVLAEQLRPDAGEIMDYFARQGVTVKIISGDSATTVSAVAGRLGIAGGERYVDLREVDEGALAGVVDSATVFGRVLPEQKRALVRALQDAGHTVAMTGDGVNDIPALKQADIGIAMDTATPATKSVAQLVLLDGRFERLPGVVAEGQRVVANMERVSSLFVAKTVYAAVFALTIGLSGAIFPFLPRHMSLISELTIGVPAFLLSFRAAERPCRPGYLGRVLRFAVPSGVAAATVALGTYWLARIGPFGASLAEARTLSTFSLAAVALWILYRLVRPMDRFELVLLAALVVALGVVGVTPVLRRFYALDWPSPELCGAAAALTAGSLVVLQAFLGWARPQEWTWWRRLAGTAS